MPKLEHIVGRLTNQLTGCSVNVSMIRIAESVPVIKIL